MTLVNSLMLTMMLRSSRTIHLQNWIRFGVGKLMKMAIDLGRPVNSSLHVGICGEHGGDPSSVEFCNKLGLDYVSCSPFRVPIARLAAAQAAIAQKNALI